MNERDPAARTDRMEWSSVAPEGTGPTWGTRGIRGWAETSHPLRPSEAQEIVPGFFRILAPNPGLMTGPGTNTYVIRSGDSTVVVDPGPEDPGHLEAVERALGGLACKAILLSHHHPDHSEGASMFKERLGAPIAGHSSKMTVDIPLEDGSVVPAGELRIGVIHTPGHASDHLCFWIEDFGVVLTGDHLMGGNTSVIAPPDGDMGDYIESLRRLGRLLPRYALPGHGQPLPEPLAAIEWYIEHRLEREQSIVDLLASSVPKALSIVDIVEQIYSDVPQPARRIAEYSVWAHLIKLEDEGRVVAVGGEGIRSSWRATGGEFEGPTSS